jgi:hypothetical protein
LVIDTVVCLTLAKWETVSGRFGGYLTVYVYITIRHGAHDEDPGEIAEGMYSVGGRAVVLTDLDGRQITSRALSDGQDPAKLARRLGIA